MSFPPRTPSPSKHLVMNTQNAHFTKDILTHRLARADGLQTHLVQPLLFQHVGSYSVILHHEKDPANVVSAGFSVE